MEFDYEKREKAYNKKFAEVKFERAKKYHNKKDYIKAADLYKSIIELKGISNKKYIIALEQAIAEKPFSIKGS